MDESAAAARYRVFAGGNRILREQPGNRWLRLTDDQRRSLAAKAGRLGRRCWWNWQPLSRRRHCCADTGKLIANKYDGSARRKPGRPATAKEIEALVVRMATENRDWCYLRILGALSKLAHELARSTIAKILKGRAVECAPQRVGKKT